MTKKAMKQILSSFVFFLFGINCVDAQKNNSLIYTIDYNIPSYVDATLKHIEKNTKNDNGRVLKELLQLNSNTTVQLTDTLTDLRGGFHESYKEYYKGIEVEGTRCTIHYDRNGRATTINGNFRTIENLRVVPFISERDVLSNVIQHIGAEKYVWQDNLVEQKEDFDNEIRDSSYPKGELVIYTRENESYLAYKFYIECLIPQRSLRVYADASTGFVLDIQSSVCETTASVTTVYSGLRNIETQSYSSNYRLRDYTRGNGIVTYHYNSSYNEDDYTSLDNTWNNLTGDDRNALDVHWGIETTFDFYYVKFGRNSYDNQGSIIKSYVNDYSYNNASWDNQHKRMRYGFYNYSTGYPLISLDITAHELTHGVTNSTSQLTYEAESGAINEGLSDVFAVCVENAAKPMNGNNIWFIGEDVVTLRNFIYPVCKYYLGTGWVNTASSYDHGGVHTNSGVFNYWFYILAHGKTDTNQAGYSYSIPGIGLDNAIQICYLMNCAYLTSNSTFADARRCSLLAAQQLGFGPLIKNQISEAWNAVGVEVETINILGSQIVCDLNEYVLSDFPPSDSIVWSLSGSEASNFTIQNNTPSAGQCTITRNSGASFSNNHFSLTLTANIYSSGSLIKTLTKNLTGNTGFICTYQQDAGTDYSSYPPVNFPATPETSLTNLNATYVYVGSTVKLKSGYFWGKDVTFSGPYDNSYFIGRDEIRFIMSSAASTSNPVVITVHEMGCDDEVQMFFYPKTYSPNYSIGLTSLDERSYLVSLIKDKLPSLDISGDKTTNTKTETPDYPEWALEIVNVTTGKVVLSEILREPNYIVNAKRWDSGLYIIRATIDKNDIFTEKINIKK